jgi:hypothetical protein
MSLEELIDRKIKGRKLLRNILKGKKIRELSKE